MFNILNIIDIRMRFQELGYEIRKARRRLGLTQATLAAEAGVSRTTLNQLENGLYPDLGIRKIQSILDRLGLELSVQQPARRPDYVRMACTTASVSYRAPLLESELVRALLTGKVPPGKRPHFRTLLDEASPALMKGLIGEAGKWAEPGRLEKNVAGIAKAVGSSRRMGDWLKTV